jgi:hypothetical protein
MNSPLSDILYNEDKIQTTIGNNLKHDNNIQYNSSIIQPITTIMHLSGRSSQYNLTYEERFRHAGTPLHNYSYHLEQRWPT